MTGWILCDSNQESKLRRTAEFSVGTNEAGMRLGEDSRGADAGVWRQRPQRWGFRLEPPVLAVEVAGSYLFGIAWKEIFYFLLFILVLVFRPAGLFGQRGSETLGA